MMEPIKGLGKIKEKGDTKDCFLFDSWFASNVLVEDVNYLGAEFIGIVGSNTQWFFR